MKAVLISIQPKWCELIANRKKTVEVRRTRPTIETPFKCYIYCTKGSFDITDCPDLQAESVQKVAKGRGKVIGEFVCDFFDEFSGGIGIGFKRFRAFAETCLTVQEMQEYLKGKDGYGWHISELKIYDVPKELGEFWAYRDIPQSLFEVWAYNEEPRRVTRPPQSWLYVEEIER
mgnify:CR=1 FL=1